MNKKIDFVIPWLDPTDPEWIKSYNEYSIDDKILEDNPRFRDWDNLHYWFRGIDRFAPWVNKIHFITYGHLPSWLNVNHPKLNIVNHTDYIDPSYLPTFSSHVLELNMHNIPDLSENFVYFNDDTFLINDISPSFYFNKMGNPKDACIFNLIVDDGELSFYILNNLKIIEKHFNKWHELKTKPFNYFNIKYKSSQIKNFLLLFWKNFTGFQNFHLPQAFNKKTFIELWIAEKEILINTCNNKFRNRYDVNQYLFRYWQLLKGNFEISNISSTGLCISPTPNNFTKIKKIFNSKKIKVVCINDNESISNFNTSKEFINSLLRKKLPNKCTFEI
ncbi:TPA: stealth family protein [Proteus mirabilis]|uniref:stealth family protein n=1 Tax=Proteus mirabilis TaxID=584 RepID=UPI00066699B5|nr:stealth family protein [Proteus mirabilis]AWR59994.1 hypothetical protein CLH65_11735 [Proteus mirabilis]ELL8907116.1 Stealth CR1 domain-containing protein [Proteus mirabilis]MBB6620103.1 Stealth CR1 domain-containing protein [Proteus mirabilis]MBG2756983.1 Stealth CR1 domain-containing protein [Proteus mirabilis]MBG2774149.1 Stealth CR1 domain-containing protein [Proteus mirabilis]